MIQDILTIGEPMVLFAARDRGRSTASPISAG